MLGGLQIEQAAYKELGKWLEGSGWMNVITIVDIATAGLADAFIKVTHLTRTTYVHQVTAAALYLIPQAAYKKYLHENDNDAYLFDSWIKIMTANQPQYMYWSWEMEFELCILHVLA